MVPVRLPSMAHQAALRRKKSPGFLRGVSPDGDNRSALSERRLAIAALIRRLVGGARVIVAVGQAFQRLAAAEEEFGGRRIADRPAAGVLVELQERAALPDRDNILDQLWLGLLIHLIGQRERGV